MRTSHAVLIGAALLLGVVSAQAVTNTVGSYTELRALGGSSGDVAVLTCPAKRVINGTFDRAGADPNGNGDDGGIVIQGAGGAWWVRRFAHTLDDPIRLDWYELKNNDDITTLLKNLARAYTPTLHVKVPCTAMTLYCHYVDMSAPALPTNITTFSLLESDAPVTIAHGAQVTNLIGATWTHHAGNVWKTPVAGTVYGFQATRDETRYHGVDWGMWSPAVSNLTENYTWRHEGGQFYMYSKNGLNPGLDYHKIEVYVEDPVVIVYLKDATNVVLGSATRKDEYNLTLKGTYRGLNTGWNASIWAHTGNSASRAGGMIHLDSTQDPGLGSRLWVRLNGLDTIQNAFYVYGQVLSGHDDTRIGGRYVNSSASISGVRNLVYENPYISDPYARTFGWDGGEGSGNLQDEPSYYERAVGWAGVYTRQVSGGVFTEWGGPAGWTGAGIYWGQRLDLSSHTWVNTGGNVWTTAIPQAVEGLVTVNLDSVGDGSGTGGRQRNWGYPETNASAVNSTLDWHSSATTLTVYSTVDPGSAFGRIYGVTEYFHVTGKDHNYTPSGAYADLSYGPGFRTMFKHSNFDSGFAKGPGRGFFIAEEAAHQYGFGVATLGLQLCGYTDNRIVNAVGTLAVDTDENNRLHSFSGNMLPSGGMTLYDRYTATKMNLHNVAFLSGRGGNLVEYCRLTGGVTMYPNTTNNVMDHVEFLGSTRCVIDIANGGSPTNPVHLDLNSITAPTGSWIGADNTNAVTVTLDGVPIELPYIFGSPTSVLHWTGKGDGVNWSDANNWSLLRTPRSGDHVILDTVNTTADQSYELSAITIVGMYNAAGNLGNVQRSNNAVLTGVTNILWIQTGGATLYLDFNPGLALTGNLVLERHFGGGGITMPNTIGGPHKVTVKGDSQRVTWLSVEPFSGGLGLEGGLLSFGNTHSPGAGPITMGGGDRLTRAAFLLNSRGAYSLLTNTITVAADGGDCAIYTQVGVLNASVPAPFVFQKDLTIAMDGNDTLTLTGVLSGPAGLQMNGATNDTAVLSGADTYTGRTRVRKGTVTVNGSLAQADLTLEDASSVLNGTGTVHFTEGDRIVCFNGGRFDGSSLKLDLTGLATPPVLLVDYTYGAVTLPTPLNNLLDAATLAIGWTLTDTGTQITANAGDTDLDGMPNSWEYVHFGSPTGASAGGDADADGLKNFGEYVAGTDPWDGDSKLAIGSLKLYTPGAGVEFDSVLGRLYGVEYKGDLLDTNAWAELTNGIEGMGNVLEVMDPGTAEKRYYRLKVELK